MTHLISSSIIHHPLSIVHSPSSYHHIIISSYHHIIISSYHHIIMSSSIIHHHHHFLANIPISISLVIDPSSITIPHFYPLLRPKNKNSDSSNIGGIFDARLLGAECIEKAMEVFGGTHRFWFDKKEVWLINGIMNQMG